MVFLEEDANAFHREDFYLAQIAREVRAVLAKKPKELKIKDFLLKFAFDTSKKVKVKPEQDQAAKKSKASWLGWLGVKKD